MSEMMATIGEWVSGNLLQLLLSVAAAFLIPVARRYGALLKDESLRRVVQAAILEVEERATKHAGISSGRKLDVAVERIITKVPGVSIEEARQLVHQELPKVRAAIGDFGKATLRAAVSSSPTS